jgi:hypothetical protein
MLVRPSAATKVVPDGLATTQYGASMSKEPTKSAPHPDDLILIGIYFSFQAKLNPNIEDPVPLYAPELEQTFEAADAADYLDKVADAIRERRLFGFLFQEQAESAVSTGEWIARPVEELIADTDPGIRIKLPNTQKIMVRRED